MGRNWEGGLRSGCGSSVSGDRLAIELGKPAAFIVGLALQWIIEAGLARREGARISCGLGAAHWFGIELVGSKMPMRAVTFAGAPFREPRFIRNRARVVFDWSLQSAHLKDAIIRHSNAFYGVGSSHRVTAEAGTRKTERMGRVKAC